MGRICSAHLAQCGTPRLSRGICRRTGDRRVRGWKRTHAIEFRSIIVRGESHRTRSDTESYMNLDEFYHSNVYLFRSSDPFYRYKEMLE